MPKKTESAALTEYEKAIISLLLRGRESNQQIQYLINIGRGRTINPARIAEIKDGSVCVAELVGDLSEQVIKKFLYKKQNYDYKTGLNPVDDGRLIYAREAMCSAVEIFNSPTRLFKTQSFCVLAIIAWTYLVHEYCLRHNINIKRGNGQTESLSALLGQVPLSDGIKHNLNSIQIIRNAVEHNPPDIELEKHYNTLFQACCLDFEKTLTSWFGKKVSLQRELSIALQFAKHDIEAIAGLQLYDIPPRLRALDARVYDGLSEKELNNLEYQFKVIYTKTAASKGSADMAVQFIPAESAEGKQIQTVLVKKEVSDNEYPFKPMDVCQAVGKATGRPYTVRKHTNAYFKYKIRPRGNRKPSSGEVDQNYCIYHELYKCYSYNKAWVNKLIADEKAK